MRRVRVSQDTQDTTVRRRGLDADVDAMKLLCGSLDV